MTLDHAVEQTRRNRRRRTRSIGALIAAATVVAAGLSLVTSTSASAAPPPTCSGTPIQVTADCVDPTYSNPVIDSETDLTSPVPNHKVSGHFNDGQGNDTGKRFNIYLPPTSEWQGRFFQSVYPLQGENAVDDPAFQPPGVGTEGSIAFGASSGAYTVQTNGGSGYRVDAAAAKFSKTVAAAYYGSSQRIFGYVWGGSGGSFQTISAIENTTGVWDGAVPYVIGTPVSIPNFFFVRAFARFVLQGKAQQIADAVAPGGSGDPYAGLNDIERAVLLEVTRIGVPLRAWEDYRYVLGLDAPDGLLGFGSTVLFLDPTYVNDFWTQPGYLGTEQSPLGDMFRAARTPANEANLALLAYHRYQVPSDPSSPCLGPVPEPGRHAHLSAAADPDRPADLQQRHRRRHLHRQHPRQGHRRRKPARHRRLPLAWRLVQHPGQAGVWARCSTTTSGSGTTTTPTTSVIARPVWCSTAASSSRHCETWPRGPNTAWRRQCRLATTSATVRSPCHRTQRYGEVFSPWWT